MFELREPINAVTHGIGIALSLAGLIWMSFKALENHQPIQLIAAIVFGLSLIALYTASTLYHGLPVKPKAIEILRRIDHTMIYVLIAGTYTPICLFSLKGIMGLSLLIAVWTLAIVGIIVKLFWMNAPRWLSTSFYVILGWMAIFFIVPLFKILPHVAFTLLVAGGVLYTIGAVIYALKPKNFTFGRFGFHEIFHLFILAGSAAHYVLINGYVFQ